jgi:hypothetical protein
MTDLLPEAVRAVATAAEQITVALQEAQQPVEQLGASVSRIIVTVGTLRNASRDLADPEGDANLRHLISGAIARLSLDAAQATVTLQFYDRMTQHLTHLQEYLEGISHMLDGKARIPGNGRELPGWPELREKLGQRLLSESQRQQLHGRTSADCGAGVQVAAGSASRSSVELF